MKKIFSTILIFMCVIVYAHAQANLPYNSFTSGEYANDSLFPNKISTAWETTDGGRLSFPKNASFTFAWEGEAGEFSFSIKSATYWLAAYGKYRVETSNDNGVTWTIISDNQEPNSGYETRTHTMPTDARMIRITNNATGNNGTTCYIQALKMTDYHLSADTSNLDFVDTKGLNSTTETLTIFGKNLTGNLSLELKNNNPNFSIALTSIEKAIAQAEGGSSIDVKFNPIELGNHKDTLLIKDGTKMIYEVALAGYAPSFQAYVNLTSDFQHFNTEFLKNSQAQKLHLNVTHLISNVIVTAPTHFEISLDSVKFSKSLTLPFAMLNQSSDTTLFVRLNTPYVGSFNGKLIIVNSEAKIATQEIELTGKVDKAIPQIIETPSVDRYLNWGETLSLLHFDGGKVINSKGDSIKGSFKWVVDANTSPEIGLSTLPIYFVPEYSYGYETADSEVNVRVLKRLQSVNWEQEFEELKVNDQIKLTAYSSSELPIIYDINKPEIASINQDKLTALAPGRVRVIANQPGNDFFDAAGGVAYYITVVSPSGLNELQLPKTTIRWSDRQAAILSITSEQNMVISVIDMQGRTIIAPQQQEQSTQITLPSSSPNGIYFLKIGYQNGGNEVIKVIR